MRPLVLLPVAFVLALGCGGGDGGTDPAAIDSIAVAPASPLLAVGATVPLSAQAFDGSGSPMAVDGFAWTSENASVATVNASTGVVTGVAPGQAIVRASKSNVVGRATVNVSADPTRASVATSGNTFVPQTAHVAAGGQVTWTFGNITHSVNWSTAGAPADVAPCRDCTATRTFPTAGTFAYICGIHGQSMSGTVVVH